LLSRFGDNENLQSDIGGIILYLSSSQRLPLRELAAIRRDAKLTAMTQMADEIRTLIADLYGDPEDFVKRPHPWFGGRSPSEVLAVKAGQFVLLKVSSRRRPHAAR
jgi:hypothetical protein